MAAEPNRWGGLWLLNKKSYVYRPMKRLHLFTFQTSLEAHGKYPERRQNTSTAQDFAGVRCWNKARNIDKGKNENAKVQTIPTVRQIGISCVDEAPRNGTHDKLSEEAHCKHYVQNVRYVIGYYRLGSRDIGVLWRNYEDDAAGDDNEHDEPIKKRVLIEIDTNFPKQERARETTQDMLLEVQMQVGISQLFFARRFKPLKPILHNLHDGVSSLSPFVMRKFF